MKKEITGSMRFLLTDCNWDLYLDGDAVFSIARPGTGCLDSYFGSIKYFKKMHPEYKGEF